MATAGDILNKTRELVIEEFSKSESQMRDGMDISLCVLDAETKELSWAGANNPLWIIRDQELLEYRPDKQPVGNYIKQSPFTNHQIQLKANDYIYIFTDGIQDQFGGPKNKKFKTSQLRELLKEAHSLPSEEQHHTIIARIENWRGDNEQVDDICLIGVSI
jgi:serine phosphatase RsbU (regulator of sigma subunit)